ncbi:hypothetical protein PCASD_06615 [Puccinia coronata f. sp. avenae]|uniref:Uncharacterized protein n=1 Tax=Puccinia coronata f. sp. avenae TaxID=200324 RepID=A0A2N5UT81_9BASI|nr:hypothetical protein PCASD_06615 [Puccinia coronata f. sp. avenae]
MSATQELLEFIGSLPPTVNPYSATATKLEEAIRTPRSPLWSRRLRVVALALYIIIFFQTLFLLYQRAKIHQSIKLQFNKLGLLVVNITDSSALAYFFSSPFTIYVLSVQVALDKGHHLDQALMLCIFGQKFIPILLGSCTLVGFCLHCHKLESVVHHIASNLRAESIKYDPQEFNTFDLLRLLLPAQRLPHVFENLEHDVDVSTWVYFILVCMLISIYIPLLTISLRALYQQSVSQSKIDAAMTSTPTNGIPQPSRLGKIHRERQRLVYHAICVFISTAVHLPPLAWKIFHSKGNYFHSVAWNEVTRHGLMTPLAFSGNIILLILNMHSYQILADRKMKMQPSLFDSTGIEEVTPCKKSFLKKLLLVDDDDEDEIMEDDVHPCGESVVSFLISTDLFYYIDTKKDDQLMKPTSLALIERKI